jgi:hypothetical protein
MRNNIKTGLISLLIIIMVGALSACQQQKKDSKPMLYVPYGINNTVDADQVYNGGGKYNPEFVSTFGYASDPDEKADVLIDNSTYTCRRDTGVEFADGDEFTFEFNGVIVTQSFHITKGDVCSFNADFGGCIAEVQIYKNGDFRLLKVKQYPKEREPNTMTPEEVEGRAIEWLNFYNRNLITGEPIVNLNSYENSPYYDNDYEKMESNFKMQRKNGWWISEGIEVDFTKSVIPDLIFISNPGHFDNLAVPNSVDDSILEEKLTPLLKQYGLISEDEGLLIENVGFPQGTPSVALASLTDGTLGLDMRIHISKNGEWTGATQLIFVPFETLGLS